MKTGKPKAPYVKCEKAKPMTTDYNKLFISLTMITFSSFNCIMLL
jgi:hypothetical protein